MRGSAFQDEMEEHKGKAAAQRTSVDRGLSPSNTKLTYLVELHELLVAMVVMVVADLASVGGIKACLHVLGFDDFRHSYSVW